MLKRLVRASVGRLGYAIARKSLPEELDRARHELKRCQRELAETRQDLAGYKNAFDELSRDLAGYKGAHARVEQELACYKVACGEIGREPAGGGPGPAPLATEAHAQLEALDAQASGSPAIPTPEAGSAAAQVR